MSTEATQAIDDFPTGLRNEHRLRVGVYPWTWVPLAGLTTMQGRRTRGISYHLCHSTEGLGTQPWEPQCSEVWPPAAHSPAIPSRAWHPGKFYT